jgi:IS605 OrfB family transposase
MKDTELITISIVIENKGQQEKIKRLIEVYRRFENALLDLVVQNYSLYIDNKDTNDFELLTSPSVIVNALYDDKSKNTKQVKYLKNKYKNNQLWKELKASVKNIDQNNLIYIISKVAYKSKPYIQKLEQYKHYPCILEEVPSLLKPPLLVQENYYIELDKQNSLSFEKLEKGNLIGIRLSQKKDMMYINLNKKQRKELYDHIEESRETNKLYSARLIYSNGNIRLEINYLKTLKYAAIDMGERNLMAVFVDDGTTKSLLVDGKSFTHVNDKFNAFITRLKEIAINEITEYYTSKTGVKYPVKYTEKGDIILNFISFLCSERNRFFKNLFSKITKDVVEYLYQNGVTDLFLSENLAKSKDNKNCELIKVARENDNEVVNHNIMKIPFAMLIRCIKQEAQEHGIRVKYINENYTSQVSCISGDIRSVQKNPKLTNAYNGKRKDELFHDYVINEKFNADLNAAANYIKVGTGKNFEWLKDKLFKLREPNKIEVSINIDVIDAIADIYKLIMV